MTAAVARRTSSTVAANQRRTAPSTRPAATTKRAPRPRAGSAGRPVLRLIDQGRLRARSRMRAAIGVLCVLLVFGFFAVAFVQAQLVAGQQELDQTRARIVEANKERARLAQAVDEASAPADIVARAQEMGMVRAIEPVYLAAVSPAPVVAQPTLTPPPAADGGDLMAAEVPVEAGPGAETGANGVVSPLAGSTAVAAGIGDE